MLHLFSSGRCPRVLAWNVCMLKVNEGRGGGRGRGRGRGAGRVAGTEGDTGGGTDIATVRWQQIKCLGSRSGNLYEKVIPKKSGGYPGGVFRLSQAGEPLFGSNVALQHLLRFLFLLLPRQCSGHCLSTCSSSIFSTCSCLLLSVAAEAASPCSLVSSAP